MQPRRLYRRTVVHLALVLLSLSLPAISYTQITLDGSMGPAGALSGPNYTIGANLGQTRGGNLFHSFGLFNVLTGQSATFTGPNSISNIISRVTGGQSSIIDGLLRSNISGANLFLINPAGMLFGPNASLDVKGSFHASTADYLKFADGAKFHADLSKQSVLTSAPVSAFGFLSQNPAGISIQESVLQLPSGKTLSIVGGDIDVTGGPLSLVVTPGGQIGLASVAAPGEVPLDVRSLDVTSYPALGQINIADSALLSASGQKGGTVVIRGGKLFIEGGSAILSNTFGSSSGGPIGIDVAVANDLVITGGSVLQSGTTALGDAGSIRLTAGQDIILDSATIQSFANGSSSGRAGDVIMVAGRDLQLSQTTIDSSSSGFGAAGSVRAQAQRDAAFLLTNIDSTSNNGFAGAAGDVTLTAGRNLSFGFGSIITSTDSFFNERAGDVAITAQDQAVIEGSDISTRAFSTLARGGDVNIAADRLTLDLAAINTGSFGSRAGHVRIDVGELEMKNMSTIGTQMFLDGAAGNIVITAERKVAISGSATQPSVLDTSVSQLSGFPTPNGNAGAITITAPDLMLENTIVSSVTRGPGQGGNIELHGERVAVLNQTLLSSGAFGDGPGGSVSVEATASVLFDGKSGITNGTVGAGDAGPVNIRAPIVTLSGESLVETNAAGSGNGGPISIEAAQLTLTDGFGLTSISEGIGAAGKGGDIFINASESILFTSGPNTIRQSGIFTSTIGDGNAGNISITSPKVVLDNGGVGAFSADAIHPNNKGNAGNITFTVGQLTLQNAGLISAGTSGATTAGAGSQVTIEAASGIFIDGSSAILNGVEGSGSAGQVKIKTPILTVSGPQGIIESSSAGLGAGGLVDIDVTTLRVQGGGVISSASNGPAPGGTIKVVAKDLNISGPGGLFTDSLAAGAAGNVDVVANQITLTDGGQISAESQGTGNTGNIRIVATNSLQSIGSSITAKSESSDGGNIHLTAGALVELVNSQITATVKGGFGSGGNITIDPTFVTLNNSQITANAFGGPGGNITIIADHFLASPDSAVTASSALSTPGTVDIQAAITNLSGFLEPLPENVLQAISLLRQSCATRFSGGKLSSFVVGSRDGLPLEPGSFMPSPLYRMQEQRSEIGGQQSAVGGRRSEFEQGHQQDFVLASVKPRFSLNGPCVK